MTERRRPLADLQFSLFKRKRGAWLGNIISTVRYWLWLHGVLND